MRTGYAFIQSLDTKLQKTWKQSLIVCDRAKVGQDEIKYKVT